MKYRPEIDGLRALAVIPVILFHAKIQLFEGGFIGVDIFFVISGYLITSILIIEIQKGTFSLIDFYERRIRRILPAMFLVMFFCIPFAWIWMTPYQLKDFSQSIIAINLLSSNILFWLEGGYFGSANEEKPLLHTWSLSVEEQYYLLFPLFLLFIWKRREKSVFKYVVLISIISFLISEWGWRNESVANFYLAPSRAWEILTGSVCAFLYTKENRKNSNILSIVGLLMATTPIFIFDENTPFPSFYTIIPVLGVALIILFSGEDSYVTKILSNKILVKIGLISYSAYLWHHPLFAFKQILFEPFDLKITLSLLVVTYIFAYLTWKFVEQPFRNKITISKRKLGKYVLTSSFFFITFGFIGHFSDGYEDRSWLINQSVFEKLQEDIKDENKTCLAHYGIYEYVRFCRLSNISEPEIAIIGDSEGAAWFKGFSEELSKKSIGLTMIGGRLFTNIATFEKGNNEEIKNYKGGAIATSTIANNEDINTVIIVSRGPFYLYNNNWEFFLLKNPEEKNRLKVMEEGFKEVLNLLENKEKVIFVLDDPALSVGPEKCISRPLFPNITCKSSKKEYLNLHAEYRDIVYKVTKEFSNVKIFDPAKILCDDEFCYGIKDGEILYGDKGHLSVNGAKLMAKNLIPLLSNN